MKIKFALAVAASLAVLTVFSPAIAQTDSASAPAASAPAKPSTPDAKPSASAPAAGDAMEGVAAWYGHKFNGRKTASGQTFNSAALTASHPTLAFGTRVKVTNTRNGRSVVVTINDRGPTTPGRIIDVSEAAAKKLGFIRAGTTDVKLEVVGQTKMHRTKAEPKA